MIRRSTRAAPGVRTSTRASSDEVIGALKPMVREVPGPAR
jgi:hypothetical protein